MSSWPHHSRLPLAALPNAPYWARRHTEQVLAVWGLGFLMMHVQVVVTELVTNAVRFTGRLDATAQEEYAIRPQGVSYQEVSAVGTVHLHLNYGPGRLLVEVWDESKEAPLPQIPDFVSERGRGLYLVSAFCEQWGWYPSEGGGKVVWAEMKTK